MRIQAMINGAYQQTYISTNGQSRDLVWQSMIPLWNGVTTYTDANDGIDYIKFSEPPAIGSNYFAKVMPGPATQTTVNLYPFNAADVLLGAW
jgi:hypothetical protein